MDPNDDQSCNASPGSSGQRGTHVRAYKACLSCRVRKVRCEMGNVDAPDEPPCRRCRREGKSCTFAEHRRKPAQDQAQDQDQDQAQQNYDDTRPAKRPRTNSQHGNTPRAAANSPGASTSTRGKNTDDDDQSDSHSLKVLQAKAAGSNASEALYVLHNAVKDNHDEKHVRATDRESSKPTTSSSTTAANGPAQSEQGNDVNSNKTDSSRSDPSIKPFAAWRKVHLVQSGWIAAEEGASIVDYFYKNLLPLTPVTIPDFQAPSLHCRLLSEEPILSVTILAIASRYYKPKGHGSLTRSYNIHDKLWKDLRSSVNRVVWAQEPVRGKHVHPNPSVPEWSKTGARNNLRSLGTIESLLLLTEWHCRSLHFPPADGYQDSLIEHEPSAGDPNAANSDQEDRYQSLGDWYEPVWRSERMSWSLLSIAMGLAFELGVFDEVDPDVAEELHREGKSYLIERKDNVKRLLFIYITQTSGVLAFKSMLPVMDDDPFFSHSQCIDPAVDLATPQQATLHYWAELTALVHETTQELFLTRELTRHVVRTGEYKGLITKYGDRLKQKRKEFDSCKRIPKRIRHILNIEYEYNRVKIFGVVLQAIMDRVANESEAVQEPGSTTVKDGPPTPEFIREVSEDERPFIDEVLEGGQNVLRAVVQDMAPTGSLIHAPVRIYFRVIHVAMSILNCFAMGQTAATANSALGLLDRAAIALQKSIVDDIHVGATMAQQVGLLTKRVRRYLQRPSKPGRGAKAANPAAPAAGCKTSSARTGTTDPNPANAQSCSSSHDLNVPLDQPAYPHEGTPLGLPSGPAQDASTLSQPWIPDNEMHNGMYSPYFHDQNSMQAVEFQSQNMGYMEYMQPAFTPTQAGLQEFGYDQTYYGGPVLQAGDHGMENHGLTSYPDVQSNNMSPEDIGQDDWLALALNQFRGHVRTDTQEMADVPDPSDPRLFEFLVPPDDGNAALFPEGVALQDANQLGTDDLHD